MRGIGAPLNRLEDAHLVTGAGMFADDVRLPGMLHVAFRRSELPQARIITVETGRARALPGVVAVYTQADLPESARHLHDGRLPPHLADIPRPVLADRLVRHVGEAIAMVVAEDRYAAADAAAAIDLELESLPAAGTVEAAVAPGAPLVHADFASNLAWWGTDGFGDVPAAFDTAPIVVGEVIRASRVCGAAMEPRAAACEPLADGLRMWSSTQAIFRVRDMVCRALELPEDRVTVQAVDVGGGFGPKSRRYPEELLVAWAAMSLGRPLKWVANRREDMSSSTQAHGSTMELELAANPDGVIRGIRGRLWHDVGAYPSIGALTPGSITRNMLCTYVVPAFALEVRAVFTNTVSTGTVRGGGGPEGNLAVERLMDRLADATGLSRVEVRRRNLIGSGDLPYRVRLASTMVTVESGDFSRLLDAVEAEMGGPSAPSDGRARGIGIAMGVESAVGVFNSEPARIRIAPDGMVEVTIGSSPTGQGHLTLASQVAAERLGWPSERIKVRSGNTSAIQRAGPTASSRTAVNVGNAVALAAQTARDRLLAQAAGALGVDVGSLELKAGRIADHDAASFVPEGGIDVTEVWRTRTGGTDPSSCHAVEIAVDEETGAIEILRYVVAYDCGVVVNPHVVQGQIEGGVVHGAAYALFEDADYEPDGRQIASTFARYAMPGPRDIAFPIETIEHSVPASVNPEGIKGAGEVGTIAAPSAIAAAIEAALPGRRVSRIPVRPEAAIASKDT